MQLKDTLLEKLQGKAELCTAVRNYVEKYLLVGEYMIELIWKDFF